MIRRLPPSLTEEQLKEELGGLPEHDFFYFVGSDMRYKKKINPFCFLSSLSYYPFDIASRVQYKQNRPPSIRQKYWNRYFLAVISKIGMNFNNFLPSEARFTDRFLA